MTNAAIWSLGEEEEENEMVRTRIERLKAFSALRYEDRGESRNHRPYSHSQASLIISMQK